MNGEPPFSLTERVTDLAQRLAIAEVEINRIQSDIESEKGTRARANSDILFEIRELKSAQARSDKFIFMAMGGLAVLQSVLNFL